jgi:hypothetical protein
MYSTTFVLDPINLSNPLQSKKPLLLLEVAVCGDGRNRTADTRIFSPLLYRLSYITVQLVPYGTAKVEVRIVFPNYLEKYFGNISLSIRHKTVLS